MSFLATSLSGYPLASENAVARQRPNTCTEVCRLWTAGSCAYLSSSSSSCCTRHHITALRLSNNDGNFNITPNHDSSCDRRFSNICTCLDFTNGVCVSCCSESDGRLVNVYLPCKITKNPTNLGVDCDVLQTLDTKLLLQIRWYLRKEITFCFRK